MNPTPDLNSKPAGPLETGPEPVSVYVLFTDVVGGSRATNEVQLRVNEQLTSLVMELPDFKEAQAAGELISLPTGDGMALVFFGRRVEAPLRCAIAIARALQANPFCKLRIGIHTGLVSVTRDINGKPNVNGEGINRAERVMSAGNGGHILLSDRIGSSLRELGQWRDKLADMGEHKCKDGWVHVWRYSDGTVGSTAPLKTPARGAVQSRRIAVGAVAVAALLGLYFWQRPNLNLASRSITYSLVMKQQDGQMRALAAREIPPSGASVKFRFSSEQRGFLYLVAEGPTTAEGKTWNWLFPEPPAGSAEIPANTQVLVPSDANFFIELDSLPGQETVHVLWSETKLEDAEAIKSALFARRTDELSAGEAADLAILIKQAPRASEEAQDGATVAKARGAILATSFVLSHM